MLKSFRQKKLLIYIFWPIGIFSLILFLYHRILFAYFISDDYEWWKLVRNLDFIHSFRLFLPLDHGGLGLTGYFRAVVGWTLWMDTVVFPMTPLTFHLTSLFFHGINALLVGMVAFYSLGRKYKAAILVSVLFVVFPFHSEAVNYDVGGRYNVVMTTFYLLSFLGVQRYSETRKRGWAFLSCCMLLLGLMSLDSAVTLPVAAFLFFLIHQKLQLKTIYRRYRLFLFSLIFVFIFYFIYRSIVVNAINPYSVNGYLSSFAINNVFLLYFCLVFLLFYLRLFVKLIFRFLYPNENIFWFYTILTGVLILPTCYIQTQERHLYLPSFAFVILFCMVVLSIYKRITKSYPLMAKMFLGAIFGLIVLSGMFLMQKNELWRNAGLLAEKISRQLAAIITKNKNQKVYYFINFPDSVNGIYVYRVRMQEAIEFAIGHNIDQKLVFTPQIIGTNSQVIVTGKKSLTLKSKDGFILFLPKRNNRGEFTIENDEYVASQIDDNTLYIDFVKREFDSKKDNIIVFQDGDVRELNP